MDFVWSTTIKDLRRRWNDPWALLLWVGIPFVVLGLLLLAFGGGGEVRPQARLLVVDLDGSFVSRFLVGAFEQGPMAEMVLLEQVGEADGRRRIRKGAGSALLVIPDGFGEAVLRDRPVTLELVTNPAQRILPGIVEETLSLFVDLVFYLQRLVGDELRGLLDQPTEDAGAFVSGVMATLEIAGNKLMDRLGDVVDQPPLSLETTVVETDGGPDPPIGAMFFQGMFFLALFFMAQGLSDDVWVEREQGTLRRAMVTPHAITAVLAGKLLAGAILFGAVSLPILSVGVWIFDFELGALPSAVVWSAAAGTMLLALMLLLQLHASSHRTGSIVTNLVMFPMIMIGGNFFPFELMPDWLAKIGHWTPNGWALEQLKRMLAGTATSGGLAVAFAAMSAVTIAAVALSARRLRGGFAQS